MKYEFFRQVVIDAKTLLAVRWWLMQKKLLAVR